MADPPLPPDPDKPDGWHEVIQPPTKLADKVPRRLGSDPAQQLHRAEQAVESVARRFAGHMGRELEILGRAHERYRERRSDVALEELRRLVHELRGRGTTLGFPLVTEIGGSLCRYLEERDAARPVAVDLIDRHVDALRIVYRDGIEGRGDALSREVVATLRQAVDKRLA